ncbi:hypothetical protein AB0383_11345 [Amycolatopsis sp. NPDC051373]|uniref:hypothetical protein n=1 Tax=Amycolatopsis sp. NPDC051373 TaxID=3155801 RepID=UPI003450492A
MTEVKVPRRMDWPVMIPNQVSICLIRDDPLGVIWKCASWMPGQPVLDLRCGVGGEVVQHDVDVLVSVRFHRFGLEAQERRTIADRGALAHDVAGADVRELRDNRCPAHVTAAAVRSALRTPGPMLVKATEVTRASITETVNCRRSVSSPMER